MGTQRRPVTPEAPSAPLAPPGETFPDLRITVEFGATLPVTDYGNVKPLVRIEGIDPRGDVERQIAIALDTAASGFGAIDQRFEQLLSEIMAPASKQPGFTQRVGALEGAARWTKKAMDQIAGKVKEMDAAQKAILASLEAREARSTPTTVSDYVQAVESRLDAAEETTAIGAR